MEDKLDDIAGIESLANCYCGSANLKELKPYGIESIQCRDCHVSLRKQDWNRVMGIPEGMALVPVEPTLHMQYAAENTGLTEFCTSSRQSRHHDIATQVYKAMLNAAKGV